MCFSDENAQTCAPLGLKFAVFLTFSAQYHLFWAMFICPKTLHVSSPWLEQYVFPWWKNTGIGMTLVQFLQNQKMRITTYIGAPCGYIFSENCYFASSILHFKDAFFVIWPPGGVNWKVKKTQSKKNFRLQFCNVFAFFMHFQRFPSFEKCVCLTWKRGMHIFALLWQSYFLVLWHSLLSSMCDNLLGAAPNVWLRGVGRGRNVL